MHSVEGEVFLLETTSDSKSNMFLSMTANHTRRPSLITTTWNRVDFKSLLSYDTKSYRARDICQLNQKSPVFVCLFAPCDLKSQEASISILGRSSRSLQCDMKSYCNLTFYLHLISGKPDPKSSLHGKRLPEALDTWHTASRVPMSDDHKSYIRELELQIVAFLAWHCLSAVFARDFKSRNSICTSKEIQQKEVMLNMQIRTKMRFPLNHHHFSEKTYHPLFLCEDNPPRNFTS